MAPESPASDRTLSRRTLLAGTTAGALVTTSGCIREVRNIIRRSPDEQLSLSIATVPGDADSQAVDIATRLQAALEVAGIDAELDMLSREEFYREILINHEFDIFVGRHPGGIDPEFLYEALHSRFADEWGWQNPFGFTNITFDEGLDRQREQDGEERQRAVREVLRSVANEQPLTPICRPAEQRLASAERFDGWGRHHPEDRLAYLDLDPESGVSELRGVIVDARPTKNLNPLSAEYRNRSTFVDLIYDSLATYDGDSFVPWLAEEWEWEESTASVQLREAYWHDGESVTADDVAFTYDLIADTSLGEDEVASPAPKYRGVTTAIEGVDVVTNRELRIDAVGGADAATVAFSVPVLPEHIWSDRSEAAELPGVDVAEGTTEAVVTDNVPPIGSGPFEFVERSERSRLELARNEDHFAIGTIDLPSPGIDRFVVDVAPNHAEAIEAITAGEADVTISSLDPQVVDEQLSSDEDHLLESPSRTVYCLGFNTRQAPLGNPYFRRNVASLLNKGYLADELFAGKATPVATPLTGDWVPDDLYWANSDPVVPFLGEDGDLDEAAVRNAFEEAGYRYDGEGRLLG